MKTFNKKARRNYNLEKEKYEAGVVLTGGEAKAIRSGHVDLSQSHARIIKGEAWLVNANIPVIGAKKYRPTRTRKLLLHRSEILAIETKIKQRKLTLVPVAVYTKKRLIKVGLVLGKTKKRHEKKETLKKKDIEREIERELKGTT